MCQKEFVCVKVLSMKWILSCLIAFICISLVGNDVVRAAVDRGKTAFSNRMNVECRDLKRSFLRVSVHGSNLRHFRVTKTPSGQPYQHLSLKCRRGNCVIIKESKFINRYLPNHPNADEEGFVAYPDINPRREQAALRAAVTELSVLARQGICGSSLHEASDGLIVRYSLSQKVESDIFNLNQQNQIVSWVRNFKNGNSTILNFN